MMSFATGYVQSNLLFQTQILKSPWLVMQVYCPLYFLLIVKNNILILFALSCFIWSAYS